MNDFAAGCRRQAGFLSALLVASLGAAGSTLADNYSVTKLATLGGPSNRGAGLNNSGQIVGSSATAEATTHAFLFTEGAMTDLGTLGGLNSYATAVNSAGQVVGYSDLPSSDAQHATLWIGVTAIDLGTSGGKYSVAYAINDTGEIAGSTSTAVLGPHAARWLGSKTSDIGSDPAAFSVARAINASAQIVGQQNDPEPLGYVWNGSTASQLLANLGDGESDAYAINAKGQVAGWAQVSSVSLAPDHAVRWDSTTAAGATDLGTLGGTSSGGLGINTAGQIVGWADTSEGVRHATLWLGTRAKDLNLEIRPGLRRRIILTQASAINDHGWIVANGVDNRTHESNAYLLVPSSPACRAREHDDHERRGRADAGDDRAGHDADSNAGQRALPRVLSLGMSEAQVSQQAQWGAPRTVSTARSGKATFDLWWYGDGRYLSFVDDCLAAIYD